MAQPYEQATKLYLAKALENGSIIVDSPNSERSHLTKGTWYLRNFDGQLVGRVRGGNVHFASPEGHNAPAAGKRTRGSRACKWPIGDPSTSDFHFCGADRSSDRPYCSEHDRIAHQKSGTRE